MKLLTLLLPLFLLTSASGFVNDGEAEILFPQAIRFVVNLSIPPDEVASAALTVTPAGHEPITIPVNVADALISPDEPQARLAYVWIIPVDDPPPLFSQIDYMWSLTATDGTVASFSDTLTFSDPRSDWVQSIDQSGRLSVTVPRSLGLDPALVRQVYELLRRQANLTEHFNLMIYGMPPGCTPNEEGTPVVRSVRSRAVVDCADGIERAVFAGYDLLVVPPGTEPIVSVVDWLVDQAYGSHWQGKDVPAWFVAGLKQFYNPADKQPLLQPVQQSARERTLYTLPELESVQTSALWQAQSYALLLYTMDRIGVQGVFDLARVNADDFATAYQQAVGQPLSGLVPALSQWIFTRAAVSAFGITPYQPPTATPAPTFTPLPSLPPTMPPTVTLTPTTTPTATVTLPPTITPSTTPTLAPPTVTPRPPGSLPTPTPQPSALETAIAQPGVQAGVVTFLILVLLLLIFLFVRLGNRR